MSVDVSHWSGLVRQQVAGRRFLVTGDALPAAAHMAHQLRGLGAAATFSLGAFRGLGPVDFPEGDGHHLVGVEAPGMMGGIHAAEAAFQALDPAVRARIDAFDPAGTCRVVGPMFAQAPEVAGRRLLGARALAWRQLEDKTIIDAVWDAAGIPRAPARVVAARPADLAAAAAALDEGQGTVWAADNKEGWYGGGARVRWVRDAAAGEAAAAFFAECADRVRVMPFLEGIPCSIHGIVFPDTVLALRPMEMIVLRRPDGGFHYARAASFWDPAPADREAMRGAARRVGAHLRDRVGYRGTFTIDGVMTRQGFRPTELNPRFGAALFVMMGPVRELNLYLLHLLVAEGLDLDWRAAELEAALLALADAHRSGGALAMVERRVTEEVSLGLVREAGGWREVREGEEPHAQGALGPSAAGGFLRFSFAPAHTPVGPSVAPRAAEILAHLDQRWELGIGPLAPAVDVRLSR